MKRILRIFAVEVGSLFVISQITAGLIFENGLASLVVTGLALTIATLFVRPVVNILLLPLNLVTFGIFKWISQAITLYLVDLVLPEFSVSHFSFTGFSSDLLTIPSVNFEAGALAFIAFSFLLSVVTSIIYWLVD